MLLTSNFANSFASVGVKEDVTICCSVARGTSV